MVFKDATAMVQAIKQHKISSQELVEQAIYKIEEQNVSVNAVVSKQYNEARQAAKYANESNAPFAGVPILLKDLGQNQKDNSQPQVHNYLNTIMLNKRTI